MVSAYSDRGNPKFSIQPHVHELTNLPFPNSCGNSFPEHKCSCKNGAWDCPKSTDCDLPDCVTQTWNVVNQTCALARKAVKEDYPGMQVLCVHEGTEGSDTTYNINRVQLVVNAQNKVVDHPRVG